VSSPALHLVAGPNGAGKSTFVRTVLQPVTHLPVINADDIAAQRWPGRESEQAYAASAAATAARDEALGQRRSFISETVFSHPSKLDLIAEAVSVGYLVSLYVVMVPEDVSVKRVEYRVAQGGHTVPETKVRERYRRLWQLVSVARELADHTTFYDNGRARTPFVDVAHYERGRLIGHATWPTWTPRALTGQV
jgi:predicted ABC-type ATPase